MPFRSIHQQLTVALLAGFVLLLGAGSWMLYQSIRSTLYERLDERLHVEALTLRAFTKQEQTYIAVGFDDDYIEDFDTKIATKFYQIWKPDGAVLQRSGSLENADLPARFGTLETPEYWDFVLPNGNPGRAIGFRFVPDADKVDRRHLNPELNLGLVVAGDRRDLEKTLAAFRSSFLGFGILTVLAGVALVWVSLRRALRPLQQVAGEAGRIDVQSLEHRFPTKGLPLELSPICGRLNDLLDRLQASFNRERRFSSDIAHELRTPLAELQSIAEVEIEWGEPADKEKFKEVLNISIGMHRIVEQLLALSRFDQGTLPVHPESISLTEAVRSQCVSIRPAVERKHLDLKLEMPEEVEVLSDPTLLASLLSNLIGNAAAHAPARGEIDVRLEGMDGRFLLTIRNTCVGLTHEDLPRLFDRFWCKDSARSMDDHYGLGLSLVRALCAVLSYRIEVGLPAESRFEVRLSGSTQSVSSNSCSACRPGQNADEVPK